MRDNIVFCISLFIIAILVFNFPEGFFIIPPFVLFLLILITLTFIQYNVFSWITSLFKKGSCVTFKTVLEIHQISDVDYNYWENFYESKKLKKDNPDSYYHYEYQKAINRIIAWCISITLGFGLTILNGTPSARFIQIALFLTMAFSIGLFLLSNSLAIIAEFYAWLKLVFNFFKKNTFQVDNTL